MWGHNEPQLRNYMKAENFLKEFVLIEKYLFGLAENFDRRQGFFNLLKDLQSKKLLSNGLLSDLEFVWQTRNKLVNSPSGESEISDEISDKLAQLKQKLGL